MISDDVVNSYHLLLCAVDLVFTNALLCNARKDLLNPDFTGTTLQHSNRLVCVSWTRSAVSCQSSVQAAHRRSKHYSHKAESGSLKFVFISSACCFLLCLRLSPPPPNTDVVYCREEAAPQTSTWKLSNCQAELTRSFKPPKHSSN